MSDAPTTLTPEQRKAAIANWLNGVPPANPPRRTVVDKLAPWRREFVDAIKSGYSWAQLAENVAKQPEIGVRLKGGYLKQCIRTAFIAAKEPVPTEARATRSPTKKAAVTKTIAS